MIFRVSALFYIVCDGGRAFLLKFVRVQVLFERPRKQRNAQPIQETGKDKYNGHDEIVSERNKRTDPKTAPQPFQGRRQTNT